MILKKIFLFCLLLGLNSLAQEITMIKAANFIFDKQITSDEQSRAFGTWPVKVYARNLPIKSISETNLFIPLQTALSLSRTSQNLLMPQLKLINARLLKQVSSYIDDTSLSQRRHGSVCFWPFLQQIDGNYKHSFSRDPKMLELFDNLDLPNDMDTSSRVFLWLLKNSPHSTFLPKFISMAQENISSNNKAFMTWVHNAPIESNTDCVVNMNILGALGAYSKKYQEDFDFTQGACDFVNQQAMAQTLEQCSYYYDRLPEITLSYALALNDGASCLKPSALAVMNAVKKEAQAALKNSSYKATELAELALSLHYLVPYVKENQAEIKNLIQSLIDALKIKIIVNKKYAFIESQSVFMGAFSKDIFDWHSMAYSTSLALEALSINKKTL